MRPPRYCINCGGKLSLMDKDTCKVCIDLIKCQEEIKQLKEQVVVRDTALKIIAIKYRDQLYEHQDAFIDKFIKQAEAELERVRKTL